MVLMQMNIQNDDLFLIILLFVASAIQFIDFSHSNSVRFKKLTPIKKQLNSFLKIVEQSIYLINLQEKKLIGRLKNIITVLG